MNILFYLDHSVATGFGGIERVTGSLGAELCKRGYQCYYIYRHQYDNDKCKNRDDQFRGRRFIPNLTIGRMALEGTIVEWDIDVIVVQNIFDDFLLWRELCDKSHKKIRLIFAHHFNAGSEFGYVTLSHHWNKFISKKNSVRERRHALKQLLTNNRQWREKVKSLYQEVYDNADQIVLLSKAFIGDWKKIAGVKDEEQKIIAIPNMLSWSSSEPIELKTKEKVVLIVARLEEKQKRIGRALRIWRWIEKDSTLKDWRLIVVGDGPDRKSYEDYAAKHLTRCLFEGFKEPEDYYRRSSIFMMTSAFEGWGLTLTEAQQFGCVPIAFNTFASASDIIINGRNGYLVETPIEYFFRLKTLMSDANMRYLLAQNAIASSRRFNSDYVTEKWLFVMNASI